MEMAEAIWNLSIDLYLAPSHSQVLFLFTFFFFFKSDTNNADASIFWDNNNDPITFSSFTKEKTIIYECLGGKILEPDKQKVPAAWSSKGLW